jgi:hypothetical protein
VIFGGAAAALWPTGHRGLATGFVIVVIANADLMAAWHQ